MDIRMSNLRTNLPEGFTARTLAIIQDLDYPMDYTCAVTYGTENIYVCFNSNDLFWWGTADGVSVTNDEDAKLFEDTARELEQMEIDCDEAEYYTLWLDTLYAARKRQMRPQGA